MPDCVNLAKCPFFHDQMENMPKTADSIKKKYCLGDCTSCARYVVFKALGPGTIPNGLFPHQVEKAQEYIQKKLGG